MTYQDLDSKLIFRIDFRPTLKYFDEMFKIASSLEGEFEHWKATTVPTSGTLFDAKNKKSLSITGQSISFSTKNLETLADPAAEISKYLLLFLESTDVKQIGRVGFRRLGIKSVSGSYDNFVQEFYRNFYGNQEDIEKTVIDKVEDVVVILQGIKEGRSLRTQFGPILPEQVSTNIYGIEEFESQDDIDLKDKTAVAVDTDLYVNHEMDLNEAIQASKDLAKISDEVHSGTWRLIKDKI
jgi:hypothetical protein